MFITVTLRHSEALKVFRIPKERLEDYLNSVHFKGILLDSIFLKAGHL